MPAPIAAGRTAEIYPWAGDTILKLYYDWCPPGWVEAEARVARLVATAGIPSPAVGEIVEQDGRRGLVYQRIQGHSLLEEVNRHPGRIVWAAHLLAELHAQIHALEAPGLSSYRAELSDIIHRTPYLSEPQRRRLLAQAASLPEGTRLCHGDFHPGNILLTAQGPMVIDWMTARAGDPWADVARTRVIIQVGARAAVEAVSPLIRLGVSLVNALYLRRYRHLAGSGQDRLSAWLPVVAAARLEENIPDERRALQTLIAPDRR